MNDKRKINNREREFLDQILNLCFQAHLQSVFSKRPEIQINPDPKLDYKSLGKNIESLVSNYLKSGHKNKKEK